MVRRRIVFVCLGTLLSCNGNRITSSGTGGDGRTGGSGGGAQDAAAGAIDAGFAAQWSDAAAVPLDVPPRARSCKVPKDDLDGTLTACTQAAPPKSFDPKLKWSWKEPGEWGGSMVIPLVANLTDDNNDGAVDLCDVPDVLVTAGKYAPPAMGGPLLAPLGPIYVLAGDTGKLEFMTAPVSVGATPAVGDLDGDGVAEIVAISGKDLVAFDGRGQVKWKQPLPWTPFYAVTFCGAISLYDLDADGRPEIVVGNTDVFDSQGQRLFGRDEAAAPMTGSPELFCPTNVAADLDGDGQLEVVLGPDVFHADGRLAFHIAGPAGHPHVANLDGDPEPELLIARRDGLIVLEHDGRVKFGPVAPDDHSSGEPERCWAKPAAVHDLNGDRLADVAFSTCDTYGIYQVGPAGLQLLWKHAIDDDSGIAASTAFDFLGRGVAQAVYGDQVALFVLDGKTGAVDLQQSRRSGTLIEYPVVADVDADDSADILVVSSPNQQRGGSEFPTLQVFEDAQKRWIPTRRIWNQHAYHVTNVREDGTIPRVLPRYWQRNNTFRTNAQVSGERDCRPPVIE